jgi:predicted MFS family arabinose efflux permease
VIPATYLPVMAREIVSDPLVFGWSWPAFGTAAFVSTLIIARLWRRFTDRQVWIVCQIVMAIGLLLPILHEHILTIIAAGLCVGGTFMIITMTGMSEAHRVAGPSDALRHIAVLTASFATGQMIGPLFASLIHDVTGGFAMSLALSSVALIATAIGLAGRKTEPAADGA